MRSRTAAVLGLVWALVVLAGGGTAAALGTTKDDPGRPYVDAVMDQAREDADDEDADDEGGGDDEDVDDEDVDDDDRLELEAVECYAGAVVDAVGVDQLERAGVTPQEFADDDDTLTDLGLEVDGPARDAMLAAVRRCGMPAAIALAMAEELSEEMEDAASDAGMDAPDADAMACVKSAIAADERVADVVVDVHIGTLPEADLESVMDGVALDAISGCPDVFGALLVSELGSLGVPVGPEARACVEAQLVGSAEALRALIEGAMRTGDETAGAAWFAGVMARCPTLIVEPMLEELDEAGAPAGPSGRACLEDQLAARADEMSAIFSSLDRAAAEAFGVELVEACIDQFDG